jgi:restriction system protein
MLPGSVGSCPIFNVKKTKELPVWNAVAAVLKIAANPLTTGQITKEILASKLYAFDTPKPESIVNKSVRRHCLDVVHADSKSFKIFREGPPGRYSLLSQPVIQEKGSGRIVDSDVTEIASVHDPELIEAHTDYISGLTQLTLERLKLLSPSQFEVFGKRLLQAYGFLNVENTRQTADGGIDGSGRLRVGLGEIRCAFECKRWTKGVIGAPLVRSFAGAVTAGHFHQGIYFTTSRFTPDAVHWAADYPHAIVLIPGEAIVEIMMRKGLGFHRRAELPLYSTDFDGFSRSLSA